MQVPGLHEKFLRREETEQTCALQPRRQKSVFQGLFRHEGHGATRWRQNATLLQTTSSSGPVLLMLDNKNESVFSPQCDQPNCSLTFKKRKSLKLHLKKHGVAVKLKYVPSKWRDSSLRSFVLCFNEKPEIRSRVCQDTLALLINQLFDACSAAAAEMN